MVYNNGYVVAIKFNGRVLRESKANGVSTVYLPFHSEYSLLLKNNNWSRCLAHVEIDGMDTMGGRDLIIDANSSANLERFILDGDLNRGRRFKFVPLSDSQVQDPSDPSNGDIIVTFTEERVNNYTFHYSEPWRPWRNVTWDNDNFRGFSSGGKLRSKKTYTSGSILTGSIGSGSQVYNATVTHDAQHPGDKGATVEGGESNQKFGLGNFGDKGSSTTIRVQLRSKQNAVYVTDTRFKHCGNCGKRSRYTDNFCRGCGNRLN